MNPWDRLLDIYFRKVLEVFAFLPPPLSYGILPLTGHLFRKFDEYACGYEPGILPRAARSMEKVNILPTDSAQKTIIEYLRFESRFVLENIWIRRENKRHVLKSFYPEDIRSLKKYAASRNYIIVTAHFSGILSMVELLRISGYKSPLIAANTFRQSWKNAKPIQRSMLLLYQSWIDRQSLLFSDSGNIIKKSCLLTEKGQSLIIAADVPGYQDRGLIISLFGRKVWVPAGAAILAKECGIPILVALPWTSACHRPYRVFLRKIHPVQDIHQTTVMIFKYIEEIVKRNPANWNGWLYLDQMFSDNG
ncbi:MAG: hypothetical protein V2I97_04685 [Desulfococcaceae bacterium]|jgi:lauroyl/myristoyl acyltransferase|nr:hypothetical protein [Desulfococcaceae bacterium]